MTPCPHCGQNLLLQPPVKHNVRTYSGYAVAAALCCGKGVIVRLRSDLSYSKYEGQATEDDWGYPITKETVDE